MNGDSVLHSIQSSQPPVAPDDYGAKGADEVLRQWDGFGLSIVAQSQRW